ncbi:class I SAM-dependent methyltransferase [Rhizobium lemnae]|uniref:Class I SAM-dependent methyltransferase n=1 Tax=Rhizobium lemnae TaxID=1214924 RepID=A0ABV8EFD6_9HYPH|nr:class I SAM-dependent methyltransferase [Rhizobium lemnae]MCJ8509574.1 class I SAM-dependent methyltransferase [Rhizobium lemnae]
MSGFDKSWLALREPADLAARDPGLVEHMVDWLRRKERPVIVDIGCGTGSSVRALGPKFPSDLQVDWRLVDYDSELLREARHRLGDDGLEYHQVDLNHLENLPLEGASVLSASAFFDLASARFCEEIAALVAKRRCAFYAALNYDGKVEWSTPHPLNSDVVRDFNQHQRMDKGLGSALGPQAVAHLQGVFESLDYRIFVAESPWILGEEEALLQQEMLKGMVRPVLEIGRLSPAEVDQWLAFRLDRVRERSSCRVGHLDILALPRA